MSKTRIASIDFGLKRVGLAITDEKKIIASPLALVEAPKNRALLVDKILSHFSCYALEAILVGLPLKLNGTHSAMTEEALLFMEELKKKASCPVVAWDERFTSLQAERVLKEAEMNRKKRKEFVDSLSAALLLRHYLDYLEIRGALPLRSA